MFRFAIEIDQTFEKDNENLSYAFMYATPKFPIKANYSAEHGKTAEHPSSEALIVVKPSY